MKKIIIKFLFIFILGIIILGCENDTIFSNEKNEYSIIIKKTGEGTVIPDNNLIFEEGSLVSLTAEPEEGYYFYRWEGLDGEYVENNKIIVERNLNLEAVFFQSAIIGKITNERNSPEMKFSLSLYHKTLSKDNLGNDAYRFGISGVGLIKPRVDGSFFINLDDSVIDFTSTNKIIYKYEIRENEKNDVVFSREEEIILKNGLNYFEINL